MHEAMVAESLLAAISNEAEKQGGKPILAKVSCGTLNAINDDVLCFAFEAIAKGTVCEGMTLEVIHRPMQGKCKSCGGQFGFDIFNPRCPDCSESDFELLPDAPLLLETIEFETG